MDSEDEDISLASFILVVDEKKKKKRKHRFWVRDIYKKREEQGVYSNLIRELQHGDREYFFRLVIYFEKITLKAI